MQKIAEGAIPFSTGENSITYRSNRIGTGIPDEKVRLSTLNTSSNDRFGPESIIADQLFLDKIKETAIVNEELQEVAKVNSMENFSDVFNKNLGIGRKSALAVFSLIIFKSSWINCPINKLIVS